MPAPERPPTLCIATLTAGAMELCPFPPASFCRTAARCALAAHGLGGSRGVVPRWEPAVAG